MPEKDDDNSADGRFSSTAVVAALSVVVTVAIMVIAYLLVRVPTTAPIEIHPPEPTPTPSPTATPAPLFVYVTGAVRQPGVVQLSPDSRVQDAVTAAGGLRPDADEQRVNQAAKLIDGQHLHVPAVGETLAPLDGGTSGLTDAPLININSAGTEDLMTLPGVGEAMAASIVAYRTEHGPFTTIEEIMDVPGIGQGRYEGFKAMITVGP